MKRIKFVDLDVHAETIAVAVAEQDGEVRPLGVIPKRVESIRKLVKKLGPVGQLRFCYEAGPTGHVVYWQLAALGAKCEVVAPTLVPVKSIALLWCWPPVVQLTGHEFLAAAPDLFVDGKLSWMTTPKLHQGLVYGDAHKPRVKTRVSLEIGEMLVRFEESLLHGIFSVLHIPSDVPR